MCTCKCFAPKPSRRSKHLQSSAQLVVYLPTLPGIEDEGVGPVQKLSRRADLSYPNLHYRSRRTRYRYMMGEVAGDRRLRYGLKREAGGRPLRYRLDWWIPTTSGAWLL